MTSKTKPQGKDESNEIQVMRVNRTRMQMCLLGTTPLIYHRLAQKAKRELLMPSAKKTKVEKATTLKHDPFAEYRDSVHVSHDPKSPTLLVLPSVSLKAAMSNAAIDIPGSATRAAIGRLAYVENDFVPVWGVPKLHMCIVRMSDMARTPDVRTRACLVEWCCEVTVNFVTPLLTKDAIANLMAGAGITQGVGDFRTQKGKGNFGNFELVEPNDPRVKALKKLGRAQQVAAMEAPEPYDGDTAELLDWFSSEAKRREFRFSEAAGGPGDYDGEGSGVLSEAV